jgi:hypothetical protein
MPSKNWRSEEGEGAESGGQMADAGGRRRRSDAGGQMPEVRCLRQERIIPYIRLLTSTFQIWQERLAVAAGSRQSLRGPN